MYYPSSENKGADQLRGYREADLRLCFRICRLLVFPRGGSYKEVDDERIRMEAELIKFFSMANVMKFNKQIKKKHEEASIMKKK